MIYIFRLLIHFFSFTSVYFLQKTSSAPIITYLYRSILLSILPRVIADSRILQRVIAYSRLVISVPSLSLEGS